MKKLISLALIVALLCFLVVTNPTNVEFSQWYARQAFPDQDDTLDQLMGTVVEYLAQTAQRQDYLVCSVFSFDDQHVLGVGLMFFPMNELSDQIETFRSEYAQWLDQIS